MVQGPSCLLQFHNCAGTTCHLIERVQCRSRGGGGGVVSTSVTDVSMHRVGSIADLVMSHSVLGMLPVLLTVAEEFAEAGHRLRERCFSVSLQLRLGLPVELNPWGLYCLAGTQRHI